jgi:tetratricopeptide (TPR) repeat protein
MKDFIKRYPDSEEAAEYRLVLYKMALGKGDEIEALYIIRDYLDHRLPSDKKYFTYKQQWRELVFRIREENLRNRLNSVGELDKIGVYQSLIDVVALASTTVPLENLVTEIKGLDIKDEYRWALTYEAGTRLYTDNPAKAYNLFTELANTASDTPKIACLLTLGNIAYRVNKDEKEATKWYEEVEKLLPLTSPVNEIPAYRLGRLYLKQGHGLKGMEKLRKFISHFPNSKYVPKAYMVLGDACVALHSPEKASRYYGRVIRISPALSEEAKKKIASLEGKMTSEQWLKQKSGKAKDEIIEKALPEEDEQAKYDKSLSDAADKIKNYEELEEKDLKKIESEVLYGLFLKENHNKKPDADRMIMFLSEILTRSTIPEGIKERALRQLISTGFFRFKDSERFVENARKVLLKHNYAQWLSELLYKMAQSQDYQAKDYVEANKSYFEYISFFPTGRHFLDVRSRIPEVYELAEDNKNAIRFYLKLIDDSNVPDEYKIKASMSLAKLYLSDEKKSEAIKTYEVALGFNSDRKPEICLRLEKLTDDFSYVQRALESTGSETYRLKALKRLIKKNEDDGKYNEAKKILAKHSKSFEEPESYVYIEKKADELAKRGAIADMEDLIDLYPEEPETPARMFKLAKMVEGTENTKYRAEDLFYEITLVYPESEFFRESKIRADNVRAIKASAQLSDMLKKGNKSKESEEIILERARLLKENLKDLSSAMENYESFIKLFPNSPHLDEVYIILGDLALSEEHNSEKAFKYWELGMQSSVDLFNRETLTERINSLKTFNTRVIDSNKKTDNEKGLREVFIIWKMEKNPIYALGLLKNAYTKLENKPQASLLHYYAGRIYEDSKNNNMAKVEYDKALSYMYHPNCRHDMILFRLGRMLAANSEKEKAADYYKKLVNKYPKSLLSRSGYYWLSKYYDEKNELVKAYECLDNLLTTFKALNPIHREALEKKLNDLGGRMNIAEMKKLKKYSKLDGGELPYYIGKVLENDLRDPQKAISQYEEFLKTNPPIARGREVMDKIAQLYEKEGEYIKAVGYLDMLLSTYEPKANNFDLILRIGTLLEHKVNNDSLTELFFSSIEGEYFKVKKVHDYAKAKLRRLEEKKVAQAVKPAKKKAIKRIYSEDDEEVLDELKEITEKYVNDLADYKMAERQMEDLWEENVESLATLDIMKALVDLNMKYLLDPDKAAKYYVKWLEENPNDQMYKEYTIKLYDHYMEVMKDGNKALRLLEDYTKLHPISLESLDIELKLAKTNELRLRNYDEALRSYQRIIDTRQNDVIVHEAYYRIGFVYRDGFANYSEAIRSWQSLIDDYYNNNFSDQAQFAIAYTYEAYQRDYTKARAAYNLILNRYPNSSLQNDVRNAILRIEGK